MKKVTRQEYPPGWTEKKVLAVIAHYDGQSDEQAAAEIEKAPEAPGETWMSVPVELIGVVTRLIEDHAKNSSRAQARNHKKRARQKR